MNTPAPLLLWWDNPWACSTYSSPKLPAELSPAAHGSSLLIHTAALPRFFTPLQGFLGHLPGKLTSLPQGSAFGRVQPKTLSVWPGPLPCGWKCCVILR